MNVVREIKTRYNSSYKSALKTVTTWAEIQELLGMPGLEACTNPHELAQLSVTVLPVLTLWAQMTAADLLLVSSVIP